MGYATRLADETAEHYAELRNRRMPRLPAVLMALWFHHVLCRAVLYDDQFGEAIGSMLGPVKADGTA
jgi:hypothetical protein